MAKQKENPGGVEPLFEAAETLYNAAHDYVSDSEADNCRFLREAALLYAEAVAKVSGR
jgi:hypothetical protein